MIHAGVLKVHSEIYTRLNLRVVSDMIDFTSENYPFIIYSLIISNEWKPHQTRKKVYDDAGTLKESYTHPVAIDIQYSYIDSGKNADATRINTNIRNLYNLFFHETTKTIANENGVGYAVVSPITPNQPIKNNMKENQMSFDVRYFYLETDIIPDETGVIETINTNRSLP